MDAVHLKNVEYSTVQPYCLAQYEQDDVAAWMKRKWNFKTGKTRTLKLVTSVGACELVQTQTIDAPHKKKEKIKCQDIQDQLINYLEIKK